MSLRALPVLLALVLPVVAGASDFRARMNTIEDCAAQLAAVAEYFDGLAQHGDRMPALQPRDNEEEVVETVQ